DHAKERCPEVLAGLLASNPGSRAEWTGHWSTTVWGRMSVCNFLIKN
ncbi:MAG: mannan-binding protein, partial [Desulfovibrio sp.]